MLKYIIIGMICCLAFEANATTVLLSDYKAPKNEEFKAFNELYLTGVMEWLLTFNAKLIARHPRNKEARLKAGLYYADF